MDESFLLRARRVLGEARPSRLDHATLVSEALTRQAATPTARLAAAARTCPPTASTDAAAALVTGGGGWHSARAAQCGCFNRAVAARGRNTP